MLIVTICVPSPNYEPMSTQNRVVLEFHLPRSRSCLAYIPVVYLIGLNWPWLSDQTLICVHTDCSNVICNSYRPLSA